eukprot:s3748_g1.t1
MSARQRAAAISGTPATSSCFGTLRGWSTSFLAGIIATVLFLELNMTATPPHVSDAESELPPPTAGFGAFLEFSGQTTLGQLVATTLDLNPREPGLLRLIAGNAAEISVTATVSDLEWPKHLYVQCSSYSEYKRVAPIFETLAHSPYQDRQVQYDNNRFTVRVFLHYVAVFRVLSEQRRLINMQQSMIDELRRRLDRVEQAYAANAPLTLTPRPQHTWDYWAQAHPDRRLDATPPPPRFDDEPEMEIPAAAEPEL